MKLSKIFVSDNKSDEDLEKIINSQPYHLGALALSVCFIEGGAWATDIMVWMPSLMEEPETVAKRYGYVNGLCVHDHLLYDAGDERMIMDTLHGKVIAERGYAISSLCVHNGVMYDGGLHNVCKTYTGEIIAKREGWVKALRSCNGILYDAGSYKKVFRTFDNIPVAERNEWIYALESYNNVLYDATERGVRNTFKNKLVARRKGIPFTLFSFNDKLYDAGQYYFLYETFPRFFKKSLLKIRDYGQNYRGVSAVQPISFWLANQLLRKAPS